ncbi:uncharacterized protein LOC131943870 [Physella acuta]|uniref:uncharacterized protein LOC131943870 n=1 Tax=Physella acuta TaxID=109671 RepID=UPI0027DC39C7|nr:uncharacterized protein LOC131943870 [Physella acuta]
MNKRTDGSSNIKAGITDSPRVLRSMPGIAAGSVAVATPQYDHPHQLNTVVSKNDRSTGYQSVYQGSFANYDNDMDTITIGNVKDQNHGIPQVPNPIPQRPLGIPEESNHIPQRPSDIPEESNHVPQKPSSIPEESNHIPQRPSSIPEESNHIPQRPSDIPEESNHIPQRPSGIPEESNQIPQRPSGIPEVSNHIPQRPTGQHIPGTFQITVQNISKTFNFEVRSTDSVDDLMMKIHDRTGIPSDQQRLMHVGKQLTSKMTLSHYNIKEGSVIFILFRMRGA